MVKFFVYLLNDVYAAVNDREISPMFADRHPAGGDLLSDLQIILQLQWAIKIAFQAAL
jgi:hypothetical protein